MLRRSQDLRSLDLNVLMIFEAIYDAGNVTRAARLLGMKQATLSNALSRLRLHFGDPLFRRAPGGVAPTPLADELIAPIRKALATLRTGLLPPTEFDHRRADRQFCIAINDFAAATLMPRLCGLLAAEAPGLRLRVLSHAPRAPLQALMAGEADLVIDTFGREMPGLLLEAMHLPQSVVIARADHPVLRGTITRAQFAAAGHVGLLVTETMRQQAEAQLMAQGLQRRMVCEVSNCLLLPGIVAESDLIALAPAPFAEQMAPRYGLQVIRMPFLDGAARLHAAIRSETARDSGLLWLRDRLRAVARDVAARASWLD